MLLRSLLVFVATMAVLMPAQLAMAAQPTTALPASHAAIASCGARAAEHAKTAHIARVVHGEGTLGGCVADLSGIAHMFVEWSTADVRHTGRICVDPPVEANAWRCTWDTSSLDPGSYVVTLTAVDAAGNRSSSEQAYRVAALPAGPPDTEPPVDPEPPESSAPALEPSTEPLPDGAAEPAPKAEAAVEEAPVTVTPPVLAPLAQVVADGLSECGRLELAPGVVADRALSLAVLDCMTPALEAAGATGFALDEIPVPPAIEVSVPDAASLESADELLPDSIGGVGLVLVLEDADEQPPPQLEPAPAEPA